MPYLTYEIKSHRIWPIWKASPIKNSNLTNFFRPFYNRFNDEININHALLWSSPASYIKKDLRLYWGSPKESDVQENLTEVCQISLLNFVLSHSLWHVCTNDTMKSKQTKTDSTQATDQRKQSNQRPLPQPVITMLDMFFETQQLDNERDKIRIKVLTVLKGRLSLNVGLENGLER